MNSKSVKFDANSKAGVASKTAGAKKPAYEDEYDDDFEDGFIEQKKAPIG